VGIEPTTLGFLKGQTLAPDRRGFPWKINDYGIESAGGRWLGLVGWYFVLELGCSGFNNGLPHSRLA